MGGDRPPSATPSRTGQDRMTEQTDLWTGGFGEDYIARNDATPALLDPRRLLWRRVLSALDGAPLASIVEIGANVGLNLRALSELTKAELWAVEPNALARERLVADNVLPAERVLDGVASSIPLPDAAVDFAFTSGVLIHVHAEQLAESCAEIHRVAGRYIAAIEYFSPEPTTVAYRGYAGQLFKRDFGAFWLDLYPDLALVDYGFFWKRATGLDNLTWWLFQKS